MPSSTRSSSVFEPGDIIVDGGNALFTDTIRREKAVRETGINFVGAGISGGEEGALNGPSIMPGGSDESWVTLGPILKSIAAIAEGEPCVTHVGHDGAGHFVKMVHNGIEYADMQLIAEAYDLIRRGTGKTPAEIADVFAEWNTRRARVATSSRSPPRCSARWTPRPASRSSTSSSTRPARRAPARGPCRPRSTSASPSRASPRPCSPASLVEATPEQRGRLARPARPRRGARRSTDADAFIEDVRLALYASKIVAYSQGFDEIVAGAEQYGWDIDKGDDREDLARRLHHPRPVPQPHRRRLRRGPRRSSRCVDRAVLRRGRRPRAGQPGAGSSRSRRSAGIPAPAFSSSLAYYDGLRAERLPAALVQGQRDFFGAHTYKRVDKPGTFHTLWSGDRTEIETTPSSH